MAMSRDDAVQRARIDLAARLGVAEDAIKKDSVEDADFPAAALQFQRRKLQRLIHELHMRGCSPSKR
jgi:hypothetical protein